MNIHIPHSVSVLLTEEMRSVTSNLEAEKGLRMAAEREASEVLIMWYRLMLPPERPANCL